MTEDFDPRPLLTEIAAIDGKTTALRELAARLTLTEAAAAYSRACGACTLADVAVQAACRREAADLTEVLDHADEAQTRMRDARFVLGLVTERMDGRP